MEPQLTQWLFGNVVRQAQWSAT